jgi:DNA-binding CsgD family transcriptional regulator
LIRCGEISAQAYRAASLDSAAAGADCAVVLEERLTRAALVARNVGRLPLAPRECQIAFLVGMDVPFAKIAARLDLSIGTLRSYMKSIYVGADLAGCEVLASRMLADAPQST